MTFNFDEPFYPRFVRGAGEMQLAKEGYILPTNDWLQEIRDEFVRTVPRGIRSHLEYDGWKVFVSLWPTDVPGNTRPELSEAQIEAILKSDDTRYLPEEIEGACIYGKKTIYASLFYEGGPRIFYALDRILAVLRHETGHALFSLAPHILAKRTFPEASRQDIVTLGGYPHMRRHGLSYFTPSHQRPHRDGEEIWAEAAASLWAGGLRINSAQTFARSTELCAMFAKFLDGQDPAHIRYDEFLKAQLTWLKNSEGRCLHGADQENRDDVFRRRNKSHGTKIKDASPRIQLMKDMRNARVETCDRGIRYRDKYLSPLNVVLTLTSELLRTSHALSDIGEIATLWGRYMARVPQPHCSEPGERSRKAAIKFGTKVLLMQMEPLTRIERARLLKTLRKHAFGQSWSKQMLFLDMLHETAVKLRAKNRDQKQKCVRPSEKGAAEKGEFEYELAAASPAARLLGPR